MSARTVVVTVPRYVSGHCGIGGHDRCRGAYAGADCRCPCHTTCPACGQPLPEVPRG